jgi:hypothetical protein
MWKSNLAPNRDDREYVHNEVALLFTYLGRQLSRRPFFVQLSAEKNSEFPCHRDYLRSITYGEFVYCASEIILDMTSDDPAATVPLIKQAVLDAMLHGIEAEFLQSLEVGHFDADLAAQISELYKACSVSPLLWIDANGQPTSPASLADISPEHWRQIFHSIRYSLIDYEDFCLRTSLNGHFALALDQPHWPTFQEYRTARTWLLRIYYDDRVQPPSLTQSHPYR